MADRPGMCILIEKGEYFFAFPAGQSPARPAHRGYFWRITWGQLMLQGKVPGMYCGLPPVQCFVGEGSRAMPPRRPGI